MLLLRMRRWTKMPSLPDTHIARFDSLAWSIILESTVLGWQHEQNFLSHLVAVLWSTAFSPFPQQMFLVASAALWWPSLNSLNINSWIRRHCMFIYEAFKSHTSMHIMLPHQLPQYYQPPSVLWMVWTVLITWYMH